jgi:TolA-binding protein
MSIDKKIIAEIERYKKINRYISEQDAPPPPGGDLGVAPPPPPGGDLGAPPPPGGDLGAAPPPAAGAEGTTTGGTEVVDVENDPDVEKVDDAGKTEEEGGEGDTEELDITELVTSQKDMKEKQESYFDQLFKQLSQLESKLGEMDKLVNQINSLEQKVERYRPKTPQEKLELRSLDSGPFNQKLTDFFDDKQQDIQKSGKNEYVLTSDEVENFSDADIRDSFNIDMDKNFGI